MGKQFDLEQQILSCWNVTSDLDVLFENIIENDNLTRDGISNVVLGMQELYELKFDKLFRTFEEFLKEYYNAKKLAEGSQHVPNLDTDTDSPVPEGLFMPDPDVNDIRQQYHEELSGLSDDELVRTIRSQYEAPSVINVNINYQD